MSDQVLAQSVRGVHEGVRLSATGLSHEPEVPLHPRRPLPQHTHHRRDSQDRPLQVVQQLPTTHHPTSSRTSTNALASKLNEFSMIKWKKYLLQNCLLSQRQK